MKKTDYIIISLNNNGSAYVWMDGAEFETTRENGEAWKIKATMMGLKEVAYKRYENDDVQVWFN